MLRIIRKRTRSISITFSLVFLVNVFMPSVSYAITGSSSMPEYRSFEPVSTTNMVNPMNGDFTYNIPLLDVPNGYPLNLSYHSSEINPEAQASWVGLGWTLNPGAINRVKRGYPDEFNGQEVRFHTKMPNDWTLTMGVAAGAEAFGFQGSLMTSLRYNNYKGFGRTVSGSVGYDGLISLGFSYEAGRIKFSPTVNAMALAKTAISAAKGKGKSTNTNEVPKTETETKTDEQEQKSETNNDTESEAEVEAKTETKTYAGRFLSGLGGQIQGTLVTAIYHDWSPMQPISMQTKVPEHQGYMFNLKFEAGVNLPPVSVDISSINTGAFVIHKYKEEIKRDAYGYFNLENRGESDMGDSYNEIENVFEKKDRYLAIPLANYDMFNVTGEALGGSFRGFRADFGHFAPEKTKSTTVKGQIGVDVGMPSIFSIIPPGIIDLETTVGMDLGGGYGEVNSGDWLGQLKGNTESMNFKYANHFKYNTNEKIIFRFTADKVGNLSRNADDDAVRANLNKSFTTSTLEFDENKVPATLDGKRVARSSYVSMRSDQDFRKKSSNVRYDVYQKSLYVQTTAGNWVDYNLNSELDVPTTPDTERNGSGIGEIVSYNGDGVRHVYGLPLKTKEEKEIRVSVKADQYTLQQSEAMIAVVHSGSAWAVENESDFKTGSESSSSYASQFLLTQMTSPDYIDRTMNGLTPDDFGSYTRFNYAKATTESKWYKYRTPFKNASFTYGSLSEKQDDIASYSGGEKELYYLQSISSKTHVAIFKTSDRKDGIGAENVDILGGMGATSSKQKRLDRIELYSLQDCEQVGSTGIYAPKAGVQPIKTVRFQYKYSLCKNLDNTELAPGDVAREGKLTLEKVWFEYEGKIKSKVSPYTFQYSYPNPSAAPYPAKYASLQMPIASNAEAQNPDYNVLDSDGWGNYRSFSHLKGIMDDLAQFYPFLYQGELPNTVDPAAWCLKVIKLPSGGEIHVQYEQHDYKYVQDQKVMAMVPLSTATSQNENDFKDKPYYLDLAKGGIDVSDYDLMDIAHQLFKPMTLPQNNNRMYFNFLFSLIGDVNPDFEKLSTDYIDGYARIAGYGVHDNKIFFYFWDKPASYDQIQEIDLGGGHTKWEMPRKACQEFYQSSRQGRISDEPKSLGEGDLNAGTLVSLFSKARQIAGAVQMCYRMKPEMSYVRLQLPDHQAKKGGGVRVKSLLMYDKGISPTTSNGDKVLYGQTYEYEKDHVSTGVVQNEPGTIRKENALVSPLDRDSQSKLEAMLYGEDMYDNEGPIGHSLYPAAAVSYSYVKISNIHKGNTSNGYEVHEFYTCKDYPFIAKYTGVLKQHEVPKGGGLITLPYQRVTPHLTQGYAFIMNDMHGKFKRLAKYSSGSESPIYEERYEYTKIGEPV
ncbi:MAG: hypothetical protein K0R51_2576, partial [Cytophagaceae bacterium]|nr:hypothetical protein [Cytophagaceae bacterium]